MVLLRYVSIKERILSNIWIYSETGCWEWQGCKTKDGYGVIKIKGRTKRVHRIAYRIFNGDFDPSLCICHKCDNPSCCNPNHLFVGTQKDNIRDMVAKGRSNKGEKNPLSKLTKEDIFDIRRLYRIGNLTQQEIADKFGVNQQTISKIVNRKNWKHL